MLRAWSSAPYSLFLVFALFVVFAVGAAHAQLGLPGDAVGPDLNELALRWSRGDWRAPLVCTIEGTAHRGLRRLRVGAGPRHARPATNRLTLFDLEVPPATHCTDELSRAQPNAVGTLYFHLEGRSRPDTARHDFTSLLRREGAVVFKVRRGRLRIGEGKQRREVDFAGGTARFAPVARGSDAWRRLASFADQRRFELALEAPDGSRLDLDLVDFAGR